MDVSVSLAGVVEDRVDSMVKLGENI